MSAQWARRAAEALRSDEPPIPQPVINRWVAERNEDRLFHVAMRTGTLADWDAWQEAAAYLRVLTT